MSVFLSLPNIYIDDCILLSPDNRLIDVTIEKLLDAKFNIEDHGRYQWSKSKFLDSPRVVENDDIHC